MKVVHISLARGVVLAFCGIWYVYHKAPKRVDLAQYAKEHVIQYFPKTYLVQECAHARGIDVRRCTNPVDS